MCYGGKLFGIVLGPGGGEVVTYPCVYLGFGGEITPAHVQFLEDRGLSETKLHALLVHLLCAVEFQRTRT